MKKGNSRPPSQSIVRILLVAPHLYQVSLFNIRGYLKNILLDRCKKVGAQYRHFENSYFVDSTKLLQLKRQFEDILHMPNPDPQMKFKIEDFPMTNIKMIMKHDKALDSKQKSKSRIIFVDRFSENRYFYAHKRIQQMFFTPEKDETSKQPKIMLVLTSEMNKKLWTSAVLKNNNKTDVKQQMLINKENHQLVELTYSELTSKKPTNHQLIKPLNPHTSKESNKVYLITYDNLKFIEGSWFLIELRKVNFFFTDDAEFLVPIESELATLENKKINFDIYKILLQNYNIENELIVFFSKLPQPYDLFKLLILTKPKHFSGIKSSHSFDDYYNENKLKMEQKKMYEEFTSWFRKRYRPENKCFKEIYYLLNNVVLKTLDQTVFKRISNMLPSLELSSLVSEYYQVNLLQSSSELIDKFKIMDKKYKKQCPTINFRQILQAIHDKQKSQQNKFQMTTKLDDHLMNKNSKNYFLEAREMMLSSKIQILLRRLFFVVNVQKERIAIVVEDEKLEKRIKKYFKETQIEYVEYSLTRENDLNEYEMSPLLKKNFNPEVFAQFDAKPLIPVCIINLARVYKCYTALAKQKRQKAQNQYEADPYADNQINETQKNICIPKITTAGSLHFIDSFWYEFCFEKELLLGQIFNCELSYIEEVKQLQKSTFKQVFKKLQLPSNYYLYEGSHEKMMLEKYLQRKDQLQSFKQEPIQSQSSLLSNFINQMITAQKQKFQNLKCEVIDYLDIDEEYDKIEEEAKRIKNNKSLQSFEEKVFLPKFTKPEHKSFKEMIEERLNLKNIDQILEESDDELKEEAQTMAEPPIHKKQPWGSKVNDLQNCQTKEAHGYQQETNTRDNVNEDSLFDCLLTLCPKIKPQTIRLESKHFEEPQQRVNPNSFESYQDNQQPEKDLFDQLLAPNLDSNYFSSIKYLDTKQSQPQDVQTESQCDDLKKFKRLKKISSVQPKIQPKIDDSPLFQNFAHMIYHKKQWIPQEEQTQIKIKTQNSHKKHQISSKQQKQDDSIEIITPDQVIDVQKISEIQTKKHLGFGFGKPRNFRQIIKEKSSKVPFYEVPKGKRLSGKKFYEEAISKSKQLWEKKVRKQKETIILAPKKFELLLVPKANWKENLTKQEMKQLKEKGINL